ncbi:MAG: alpha-mannosidase, partial [Clostridia bacterium]|nr:alpha-mannosidase [Clostridia bacterium]
EIYLRTGHNDVLIYAYKGMIDDGFRVSLFYKEIDLDTQKLYYDLVTVKSALTSLGEHSQQYSQLCANVKQALTLIDINGNGCSFYDSVKKATAFFDENIWTQKGVNELATVSFTGHTHIDVAWLWTLAQTSEKVQRSCATVLKLMEKYPDYKFFLSQPVLYNYVKENLPDIYEKISEQVKKGNWETEGSMWVEADCNLSGGESLIRQIFYGKKFFKEEFGEENSILWLPDAFGFSAALPQILKKCNIDTFITSKLSWSETNKYPHDIFMWRGIDGSEILTNFITARDAAMPFEDDKHTRYNGYTTPSYVLGAWQRFQDKPYSDEIVVPFGYGDGGGSANEKMLEILERTERGIAGFPKTKKTGIKAYAERIHKNFEEASKKLGEVPKWFGELYLELHRGTFTSMSEIKKYNRFCEFLYQKAEQLAVVKKMLLGGNYPAKQLEKGWKNILLNQFHDILPGSSIKEVYNDAFRIYEETYNSGKDICNNALSEIAANVKAESGILVYNANSFPVTDYVSYNGKYILAENIPAMGWKVIDKKEEALSVSADKTSLENLRYKITFNEDGNIVSIFDKKNLRETVKENRFLNIIEVYENIPYCYDAWEISEYYKDKCLPLTTKEDIAVEKGTNFAQIKVNRKFSKSTLTQTTRLYNNSDRIDFVLDIDWNEEKTLIKAAFPLKIHTDEATFDIQFGSITRPTHSNTSWEKAKFEVCGHKWADMSEDNYGVSIINNSKYGFSCVENELKMTLLTSPKYPNPEADIGKHTISYSLFAHEGNVRGGDVVKEAYKFNQPLSALDVCESSGSLNDEFSLLTISSDTVIAETVKQAEDGNGYVLRLFEASGRHTDTTLSVKDLTVCTQTNLLEEPEQELPVRDSTVQLRFKPYEILTLRFV